jgi:hypothetical protein
MMGLTLPLACLAGNKPTDVRLQLLRLGYTPLPLTGKACFIEKWTRKTETNAHEIAWWSNAQEIASRSPKSLWASRWQGSTNTGMLCTHSPALDLDILDGAAVDATIALVRERFGERGKILQRYGLRPKVVVPFRTDAPFSKIQVILIAPNGKAEKVECLGRGQQVVVHGVHPDTGQAYEWHGGAPWQIARAELPPISEREALALVDEIAELLCRDYGYQRAAERPKISDTPSNASLMEWQPAQGDHEIPKRLYLKVRRLMPNSRGIDRRRVIGLLRKLVRAHEGRNDTLFNKACAFRKANGPISDGIIGYEAVAELLMSASVINQYVAKDGADETIRSICSGLGLQDISDALKGRLEAISRSELP